MVNKQKPAGKASLKNQNLIRFGLLAAIIVMINLLSSFVFSRYDLTTDKRFTLTQSSKELLKNLKDIVYIKVYLSGDFPPGFKKLENAARETLDEMRIFAGDNLSYEFIDPASLPDDQKRKELYQQLMTKGIIPTNLEEQAKDKRSERLIFPGALIYYGSTERSFMLLKDLTGNQPEQMINNSIQNLEFEIINAIRKITTIKPERIAFIEGHDELNQKNIADIAQSLAGAYELSRIEIKNELKALDGFKTLVIAKPMLPFDEKDKFIIDQFIMKGGRVLWLIDGMYAEMDSLSDKSEILAVSNSINLDDMLFRYGARINNDLVQDVMAAPIPVVTGYIGDKPKTSLLPWSYFPIAIPESNHPIVKNINPVRFQFPSSIDIIGNLEIKKTILLTTSEFAKTQGSPARVSLEVMREKPDLATFNKKYLNLAVLLEGSFSSLFENRIPPAITENKEIGFLSHGKPTKMIVISDGDVIRNDYIKSRNQALALGYDRYTGETYGNKTFLLNAIDYLTDDSGIIYIRSKELKLRILDKQKLETSKANWQLIVTAGPILLVLIFGMMKNYWRKKKFAA
ncbi:MAG: gliding motility-associated ABC transporter substrate-binding protein GldG [Bacteroidia bacterium]|nr:gliding motility-associated ABC transporter substrate-binding protein GldG [Bacteroidia bacterium]